MKPAMQLVLARHCEVQAASLMEVNQAMCGVNDAVSVRWRNRLYMVARELDTLSKALREDAERE